MIKLKDLIFEKRGPCWKGYSQIGMKKKGNKMVPNCVKNEEKISEKKIKPMQKISKKEWSKIKKFNKHIGQDGTYYVMQLTNKGTALVPVVVEGKLKEQISSFNAIQDKLVGKTLLIKPFEVRSSSEDLGNISKSLTDHLIASLPSTINCP